MQTSVGLVVKHVTNWRGFVVPIGDIQVRRAEYFSARSETAFEDS